MEKDIKLPVFRESFREDVVHLTSGPKSHSSPGVPSYGTRLSILKEWKEEEESGSD